MVAARISAEKLRFRDDALTAENENLKVLYIRSLWIAWTAWITFTLARTVAHQHSTEPVVVDADTNRWASEEGRRVGAGSQEAIWAAEPSATDSSPC